MKRTLSLLLALLLLLTCTAALAEGELRGYSKKDGYVYLTLGTYPQTETGGVQPILWRVLQVENGRAYLVSEYVLDARRIHGDYKEYADKKRINGNLTKTELGAYLNGDFMLNFADGELALIAEHDTWGCFTLLSSDDLKSAALGFGENQARKAWGTEWAKVDAARGDDLFVYGHKYGSHSPYWLRDQSTSDARHARCTKQKGEVGHINVITVDLGMRPACWLDMDKVVIASGSGTMEDPFVLKTGAAIAAAPIQTEVPAEPVEEEPAEETGPDTTYHYIMTVPEDADPASCLSDAMIVSGAGTAEDPFILAPRE